MIFRALVEVIDFNGSDARALEITAERQREVPSGYREAIRREALAAVESGEIDQPGVWLFEGQFAKDCWDGAWRFLGESLMDALGIDRQEEP